MAYGHAERALAAIQALEAETAELLRNLPQLDAEQSSWLEEVMGAGRPAPAGAASTTLGPFRRLDGQPVRMTAQPE